MNGLESSARTGSPTAFVCVPSPIGPICLTASPADGPGLTGLFTDAQKDGPARTELWSEDPTPFKGAIRELGEYFAGTRRTFDVPLRSTGGTPFQRDVWRALRSIPYGTTVSYGEIARRVGRPSAVRAVGAAISKNPWGIVVPCHRVVATSGELTGFAGGVARKRWLLEHEGIRVAGGRDGSDPRARTL